MNLAALWDLPVLFVCVNNQYGMGTRIDHATRSIDFDLRAKALCLAADMADGRDVEEVMHKAQALADGARQGKPGFLSVSCYRFYGHGRMDKSPYRTPEEEEAGRKRDPVAWARSELVRRKLATTAQLDEMDAAISREMSATIDFTASAAQPPLSFDVSRRVCAGRAGAGAGARRGSAASWPTLERRKWSKPHIATRFARR